MHALRSGEKYLAHQVDVVVFADLGDPIAVEEEVEVVAISVLLAVASDGVGFGLDGYLETLGDTIPLVTEAFRFPEASTAISRRRFMPRRPVTSRPSTSAGAIAYARVRCSQSWNHPNSTGKSPTPRQTTGYRRSPTDGIRSWSLKEVIPQQSADNSHAALLQAKAAYEQLVALQSYEVMRAETYGIITARYVDPGALIPQVTSLGGSTPIVELAALHPLRVYADVPQDIAAFVKDGDPATVTVTQYPGRKFQGTVTRHPEALAPDTRTKRVEVDLPNKASALYPGMYATVVLNVDSADNAPRVPDDALIFRNGATYVPVVQNNRIHLAKIALGNDDGREVEIANGLSAGELIAVNVGEGVEEGDPVQPVMLGRAEQSN